MKKIIILFTSFCVVATSTIAISCGSKDLNKHYLKEIAGNGETFYTPADNNEFYPGGLNEENIAEFLVNKLEINKDKQIVNYSDLNPVPENGRFNYYVTKLKQNLYTIHYDNKADSFEHPGASYIVEEYCLKDNYQKINWWIRIEFKSRSFLNLAYFAA